MSRALGDVVGGVGADLLYPLVTGGSAAIAEGSARSHT